MATAIPRWKTDWTKCCLCQEDRADELKSPPTRYAMEQDGYSMIGKKHTRSRDPTTLFPQLEQLLFSTSDALHTRQHVYGAKLWCSDICSYLPH